MKKLLLFVAGFALAVLAAGPLWAHGSAEHTTTQPAGQAAAHKGRYYIANTTLTFWAPFSSRTAITRQSYNQIPTYQAAEKITGVKIKYESPPLGEENQQFNLLLASGDLPDIVYWNWLDVPGGPEGAVANGDILKLNSLVAKDAPAIAGFLNSRPNIAQEVVTDKGTLYEVPFLRTWLQKHSEIWERYFRGPMLRGDWLAKLGLKPPKTMQEWETVLKAIKGMGPNIIPLADLPYGSSGIIEGLKDFYGAWGAYIGFYVVNGKVHYGAAEPQYKAFLTDLHRWYSEGLIDPSFVTRNYSQVRTLILQNRVGAFWGRLNGEMGGISGLAKQGGNSSFKLAAAPWPYASDGKSYQFTPSHGFAFQGTGAAITPKNPHPNISMKWLNFWWTPYGHLMGNFGIEGETFTMVNGFPTYTNLIMHNPKGLSVVTALAKYAPDGSGGRFWIQDGRYWQQMMALPQQYQAGKMWVATGDTSRIVPPVTPTTSESRELASLLNQIKTYRDSMFVKFVVGQAPLSEFDSYMNEMKTMGIDKAIAIEQAAYDRYLKRPVPHF